MAANLYFLSNGSAVEMKEQVFQTEDVLQKIIEENPHLLARSWDDHECRLFLIKREMPIMESDDSSNSFSLDHLLVGEDGIPVLVEVKRSTNTQIRREIVGQMTDYACRAAAWNIDELRGYFKDNNPDDVLEQFNTDEFWNQVETNLKAERLRLVFAADKIPDNLRAMIEFLDRNMKDIEVYGVEIRQYQTSDAMLLSSNIIGNSLVEIKKMNSHSRGVEWTADSFAERLKEVNQGEVVSLAEDLKDFTSSLGLSCRYGRGIYCPSFSMWLGPRRVFGASSSFIRSRGRYVTTIELNIHERSKFLGDEWPEERLRSLLSDIPGKLKAYEEKLIWDSAQYLYIDLGALSEPENMAAFKKSLKTLCDAIQKREDFINTQNSDTPPEN